MKKGFFFSIDATIGIAIVLAAIAAMVLLYQSMPANTAFSGAEKNASDAATVAFYSGKTASDFTGLTGTISATAKNAYCAHYFTYNPGTGTITENIFCDET